MTDDQYQELCTRLDRHERWIYLLAVLILGGDVIGLAGVIG